MSTSSKRKADGAPGTSSANKRQAGANSWSTPAPPTSSGTSSTSESPRKVVERMDDNKVFTLGPMDKAREVAAEKYRKVAQVPMASFLKHCIAEVAQERIDTVVEALRNVPIWGLNPDGHVLAFSALSPAEMHSTYKTTEKAAFRKLGLFIKQVLAKDPNKTEKCDFPTFQHTTLERTPTGTGANTARADAYGHFDDLDWANIFLAEEFKLWDEKDYVKRNRKQIIWSGTHMLRDDARREFSFGLTVEDKQAQLWRFGRSGIIVSDTFAWIEDPKPLIQFILSLAYYPTTEDEYHVALSKMGFDPTLRIIKDNGKVVRDRHGFPQYHFDMQSSDDPEPVTYETVEVLVNSKANDLLSRATRVWRVRRANDPVVDGQEHWVMKECYAPEGVDTEGVIWRRMKRMVDERAPAVDKAAREDPERKGPYVPFVERFQRHFLQLKADDPLALHPDVPMARLLPEKFRTDRILDILGEDPTSLESKDMRFSASSTGSRGGLQNGGSAPPDSQIAELTLSGPRRKQRTLWKDANHIEPLDNLRDIRHMNAVLLGTCEALEVLYELDLVHRDISCGNIYYDDRTKTGRLGDFEFVKEYGKSTGGHIKTGTPLFWSPEVQANDYFITNNTAQFDFAHHYIHDAESLHWLWEYILSAYAPKWVKGISWADATPEQRNILFRCFIPKAPKDRYSILSGDGEFPRDLDPSIPRDGWTLQLLLFVNRTLGTWIVRQHHDKLHPAKHSISAAREAKLTGNRPITKRPTTIKKTQAHASNARKECIFAKECFKHIFSELKELLNEIATEVEFDHIAAMSPVREKGETICTVVAKTPEKGGEKEGDGEIVLDLEERDKEEQARLEAQVKLDKERGSLGGDDQGQELTIFPNPTTHNPNPTTPTNATSTVPGPPSTGTPTGQPRIPEFSSPSTPRQPEGNKIRKKASTGSISDKKRGGGSKSKSTKKR